VLIPIKRLQALRFRRAAAAQSAPALCQPPVQDETRSISPGPHCPCLDLGLSGPTGLHIWPHPASAAIHIPLEAPTQSITGVAVVFSEGLTSPPYNHLLTVASFTPFLSPPSGILTFVRVEGLSPTSDTPVSPKSKKRHPDTSWGRSPHRIQAFSSPPIPKTAPSLFSHRQEVQPRKTKSYAGQLHVPSPDGRTILVCAIPETLIP
jgi:hypothetical protein